MTAEPISHLQPHLIEGLRFQVGNSCKLYEHNWLGNRQATLNSCLLLGARKSAAGNLEHATTTIKASKSELVSS